MKLFSDLRISASGMEAERRRMELISDNIANINSPYIAGQPPYRAKQLVTAPASPRFGDFLAGFRVSPQGGVNVLGFSEKETPPRMKYEPDNPLADANGYVSYPDINILDEMINSVTAVRTYEANLTTFNETKRMINKAMDIGK